MVRKGKFAVFKANKKSNISETGETTPTKIGFYAFHMDLYLHEVFGPVLFFKPHGTNLPFSN